MDYARAGDWRRPSTLLLPLCIAGCYYPETAATHIVQTGEEAVLANRREPKFRFRWPAKDVHALARAFDTHGNTALQVLVDTGSAAL